MLRFISWGHGRVDNRFSEVLKFANYFRGRKLAVHFCVNYLYSNELNGLVDLSDFNETWSNCSPDISAPKCVRLLRKNRNFLVTSN